MAKLHLSGGLSSGLPKEHAFGALHAARRNEWCRLPFARGCASARVDTGVGPQSLAGRDAIVTAC